MERICLFPGTLILSHLAILISLSRALPLFDKLYIGLGRNSNKIPMFSEEQRVEWLKEIYKDEPKDRCSGL